MTTSLVDTDSRALGKVIQQLKGRAKVEISYTLLRLHKYVPVNVNYRAFEVNTRTSIKRKCIPTDVQVARQYRHYEDSSAATVAPFEILLFSFSSFLSRFRSAFSSDVSSTSDPALSFTFAFFSFFSFFSFFGDLISP
jgi:hypothetical protein